LARVPIPFTVWSASPVLNKQRKRGKEKDITPLKEKENPSTRNSGVPGVRRRMTRSSVHLATPEQGYERRVKRERGEVQRIADGAKTGHRQTKTQQS